MKEETQEPATIILMPAKEAFGRGRHVWIGNGKMYDAFGSPQCLPSHLYVITPITDNNNLAIGDWFTDGIKPYRVEGLLDAYVNFHKIIASTDTELGVPPIADRLRAIVIASYGNKEISSLFSTQFVTLEDGKPKLDENGELNLTFMRTLPPYPAIRDYINKAVYDSEGQIIFRVDKEDGHGPFLDVRGWGAIQNLFMKEGGKIDESEAMKFQDAIGEWVAEAINEKLKREKPLQPKTFHTPLAPR